MNLLTKNSIPLCHGISLLLYLKNEDAPLIQGKKMTGFTDDYDYADTAVGKKVMPFRIEDEVQCSKCKCISAFIIIVLLLIIKLQNN